MTAKEITVFLLGLLLIGFLYHMKQSQDNTEIVLDSSLQNNIQTQPLNNTKIDFTPKPDTPILDRILDIPAWTFDISKIGALTTEEIKKSIEQAIEDKRFFEPENNNALFYLVNLKIIDENNEDIDYFNQVLKNELDIQVANAIENNNEDDLMLIIGQNKTLDASE